MRQHPGGQRVGGVAGQHRHAGLAQDRAGIQVGGHLMHGAAGLGVARLQRALVGVQAGVFRQQ
jgi:hypothetical protein